MQQIIQQLPSSAGVYQYFNIEGKLLYIGKAKNLKNRVKSYWRFTPSFHPNSSQTPRILRMLEESNYLEYIVVASEEDALVLENSLIKQLNPKYNILLRDDKTYPYIYLDESSDYPRFEITRKIIKKKNITYFGPFPVGGKALFNALYEVYPLVQKSACLKGKKACLFYQIKKCLAPCEEKITPQEYGKILTKAKKSIIKRKPLIKKLTQKMTTLALKERYEEAGKIRDTIEAISTLTTRSNLDLAKHLELDIFAILNGEERGVVVKLFMREGKVISSSFNYFRHTHIFDENEAYKQAILDFYTLDVPTVSKQILTAHPFEDSMNVAQILSKRFSKKVTIKTPKIGEKYQLTSLALQNCQELLKKEEHSTIMEQRIADIFKLTSIPYRVETFDNSHLMGVATVGGMVVWNENRWEKNAYRRYELHYQDEYRQMKEMLSRRIEKFNLEPAPDLWILDGGKANLMLAISLLQKAKVNLNVIAIAKEKLDAKAHRAKGSAKDIVYTKDDILSLLPTDKRLHWVQRQRDEAHRYAITYHQNKKRKEDVQLMFLNKKGIGQATIKKLIAYFGTFEALKKASKEEIEKITNKKISNIIINNKQ